MKKILFLHPKNLLFLSNGAVFANENEQFEILGKDREDNFTSKKISRIGTEEKKYFEIITEQKIFDIFESYVLYGAQKPKSVSNINLDDHIFNFTVLNDGNIINKIKNSNLNLTSIQSYICGFQSAIVLKLLKYDQSIINNILSDITYFQFLNIANKKFLNTAINNKDILLEKIIRWHISSNFMSYIIKFFPKYYQDRSHIQNGIIRCSIPYSYVTEKHSQDGSFLPSFVFYYENVKYFLIGFFLGMMWDGELYNYVNRGLSLKNNTGGLINTEKDIWVTIKKDNILLKYLSYAFSLFNLEYYYYLDVDEEANSLFIQLPPSNLSNILGDSFRSQSNTHSQIISVKEKRAELLEFEIETDETGWRPILDYNLLEID